MFQALNHWSFQVYFRINNLLNSNSHFVSIAAAEQTYGFIFQLNATRRQFLITQVVRPGFKFRLFLFLVQSKIAVWFLIKAHGSPLHLVRRVGQLITWSKELRICITCPRY